MNKRLFLVGSAASLLVLSACSTTGPNSGSADPATKRVSINAEVDRALSTLYAQVKGSRELVAKSRGVLVFPSVVSAGFIVGGSYGQGALRIGGKPNGYYSMTAGSVGLLAGAESKAVYVLFLTQDSLNNFVRSNGWTAGADASVTIIDASVDAVVSTDTVRQPIVGYVLTSVGFMANLSLDGTKFTRLDL